MDAIQGEQKNRVIWHDLGGWNYYFIVKLALLWGGYLNFHPLANLVFMAFLLFPVPWHLLHRIRNWIAIPVGLLLFYHDTWLPGTESIISQGSNLFSFSPSYLLELLRRFINWQLIGIAFVLFVAYLYLSQWVRITVFTIIALVWLNVLMLNGPAINLFPEKRSLVASKKQDLTSEDNQKAELKADLPPTNENLNAYLDEFYRQQSGLHTDFPAVLEDDAQPFDIILIQICSLAWADLKAAHLMDHPVWNSFDIMFNEFNSAASYSGPAAIRLLRASCGQSTHAGLYKPVPEECYLMNDLAKLGFSPELMLDHEGTFGDFLKEIRENSGLEHTPLISRAGISPELIAFNGQLLSDDSQLLNRWIKQLDSSGKQRNVTYFNEISLHDGNRNIGEENPAPYSVRLQRLLDQTLNFFDILEKSGRKTLVVFIPEHGANITGDRLQMPGLRDIPSPAITHIPVGIKLVGMKSKPVNGQIKINAPSSYLAVSELIKRLVNGKVFAEDHFNLEAVMQDLPKTAVVSTNEGSTMMKYQDKYYILLKGDSNWVPYPQ